MYLYFNSNKLVIKGTPSQVCNTLRSLSDNDKEPLVNWLKRHTNINRPRK